MTPKTLLLRHVHPNFIQNGRISSQAFRPTSKDNNKLSVDDGDRVKPEESYDNYTSYENRKSAGVVAITVVECEQIDLAVRPDTLEFNLSHCLIVFPKLSRGQLERKAKILRRNTEARGWLYHP